MVKLDIMNCRGRSEEKRLKEAMVVAKEIATAALPVDGKNRDKKQVDFAMAYGLDLRITNRKFGDSICWLNGLSAED